MKTIYLHIGTHKTGSTSIQRFLAQAANALAEEGVIYPETGRPDTDWSNQYGQHQLAWSLVGKKGVTEELIWDELAREINHCPASKILISAEGFGRCTSDQIQRLISHFDPYPIQVLVYLRPPLSFLESAYAQRVKMGTYSDQFVRFVDEMTPRCDYADLVARWDQFDQVLSVDIRLFDKVKNEPGLEASIVEAVGVDFERVRSWVGVPANRSPSSDVIRVVRWINAVAAIHPDSDTWRTLTHRVRSNVLDQRWFGRRLTAAVRPFLRDHYVTEEAKNRLRKALGETHQRFLESYIPRRDWSYLPL